jgi:hypothetical protein
VAFLDREVGREEWAMVLTADHASMPDPTTTGAFQISSGIVAAWIQKRFDGDGDDVRAVRLFQPTQLFMDLDELESHGGTIEEVARYAMTLTQAQTAGSGVTPKPGQADDPVFAAVFPSRLMRDLPCLPEASGG